MFKPSENFLLSVLILSHNSHIYSNELLFLPNFRCYAKLLLLFDSPNTIFIEAINFRFLSHLVLLIKIDFPLLVPRSFEEVLLFIVSDYLFWPTFLAYYLHSFWP
jgi:hypothetical protein